MNREPESWKRLGALIRSERQRQGLSRGQLAIMASVSVGSVQTAERGNVPKERRPYTLDAIERALGWAVGSIDAVLEGGQPSRPATQIIAMADGPIVVLPAVGTEFLSAIIKFSQRAVDLGASAEAEKALYKAAVDFIITIPREVLEGTELRGL